MKIQTISCNTCGRTFAACIEKYADAEWYKQCARYLKTNNVTIQTVESDGNVFDDMPVGKCCGKRVKPDLN